LLGVSQERVEEEIELNNPLPLSLSSIQIESFNRKIEGL